MSVATTIHTRCFLLFLALCTCFATHRSVAFKDIETLVLKRGHLTTGRRIAPIQQTKCVGGDAQGMYEPEVFMCKNIGLDDQGRVAWKCEAEMDDKYRLGTTDINCEGWAYSGDQNVLEGSCSVSYTLHFTEKGRNRLEDTAGKLPLSLLFVFIGIPVCFGVGFVFILVCTIPAYYPPHSDNNVHQRRKKKSSEKIKVYHHHSYSSSSLYRPSANSSSSSGSSTHKSTGYGTSSSR